MSENHKYHDPATRPLSLKTRLSKQLRKLKLWAGNHKKALIIGIGILVGLLVLGLAGRGLYQQGYAKGQKDAEKKFASQPRGSQYTPSTQPKSDQKMSTVLGIIDSISATELAVKSPAGKIEIAKPTAETQVLDIDGNPTAIKAVKKGARASVSITTEPDGTKQVKRIRLLRASKN